VFRIGELVTLVVDCPVTVVLVIGLITLANLDGESYSLDFDIFHCE